MKRILLSLLLGCSLSVVNAQISTSGMVLWLKADAGVKNTSNLTATNGQSVQTWEDQSGNGNHAVQPTTSEQPVWNQNGGNGGSSLTFSSSALECANTASLNPSQMSIFVVGKYANTGSYQTFLMKTASANWNTGGYGISQSGSSSTMTGWINSYSGSANVGSSSFQKDQTLLFSMVYQQGSLTVFNNGLNTINASNAPAITSTTAPLMIGNSPGNFGLYGDISEIIIYNTALSTSQRETVEEYLRTKYTIYSTTNPTGPTWTGMTSGTSGQLLGLHFPSSTTGYSIGSNVVLKSTDAGINWNSQTVPSNTYGCVHFRDNSNGLVGGNGGAILVTTDGGSNWTSASTPVTQSIWGICHLNDTTAVAVGSGGTVLRSTDGGLTWTSVSSGTSSSFWAVNFSNETNGIAVGNNIILTTTDGGLNWENKSFLAPTDLRGVWYLDATTAIAVGLNGVIYKTTNNGDTWLPKSSGVAHSLYAVNFLNDLIGVASGDNGTILVTTNGGESWVLQNSGTTSNLRGAGLPSNTVGVVNGFSGTIRRTEFTNLSINEVEDSEIEMTLYPNPNNGQFMLTVDKEDVSKENLIITDVIGKQFSVEIQLEKMANSTTYVIKGELPAGMYLSHLNTTQKTYVKRFMVK